ncbi:MAG: hypothetical protein ACREOO_09785 [bacterium]
METDKNYSPEELRREAILILNKKLGAFNTYRFLAQMNQTHDDYLALQGHLFDGQSVDELYNVAELHWQKTKTKK